MRHRITGVFIVLLAIGLFWSWNTFGKQRFAKSYIPVLKEDIYAGDVLTEDMIEYCRGSLDEGPITRENFDEYIGNEAKHFVHKGVPLFSEYFLDKKMDPNVARDKVSVALSTHHIYNFTGNYKKGDKIIFFSGKDVLLEAIVRKMDDGEKIIEVLADKAGASRISEILSKGNKLVIARG